ncbi:glycosyltransferase family 2 protein, partial [Nanoarchaeota archaeon]
DYTYVAETIIQANNKNLKMVQVPCRFKKRVGKSRLIRNVFNYAWKAGITIIRTFAMYQPLKIILTSGILIFLLGVMFGMRVLVHFFLTGMVSPYIPTAILATVVMIVGFQLIVLSVIAEMINSNRRLNEDMLYRMKKLTLNGGK